MTRLGHVERVLVSLLRDQPLDTNDLAHAVGRPQHQVRACLRRLRARGLVDQLGIRRKINRVGASAACWRILPRREEVTRTQRSLDRDLDVLTAVERLGAATAAELVRASGWGRTDVYRALRALEDRELVCVVVPTERDARGTRAARWTTASSGEVA